MQHDCNCWMAFAGSLRNVQKTLFLQYFEMEPFISTEFGWNMGAGWEFGCHVFHPDVQSTLCAWPDTEYTRWHLETTNEAYCKTLPAAPFWMYWTYSFSEWQTWLHSSKSCFGFIFSMTWHGTFYDWYHPFCCSFSCCLLFVVVAVFVVVVLCVLFVVVVKSMSIKCQ